METARTALPEFFKANAAILSLILAALAVAPDIRQTVSDHPVFALLVLLAVESGVVLMLSYVHRRQSPRPNLDQFSHDALNVDAMHGRFATSDDFPGTERVYHEWFKPHLSIDDGEYCKLMDRGEFVRVIEVKHSTGSQQGRLIAGYYSVWPLSEDTFNRMARGRLREREVTSDMILSPSDSDATVLYVPEICASRRAWDVARQPLVIDLARYVGHLLIENPSIQKVAAWPYSREGRRYVEWAKMKRVRGIWVRKFCWASRETVLTLPQARRTFKVKWTITY